MSCIGKKLHVVRERFPTDKEFQVCPNCGSKRAWFESGEEIDCPVDGEPCLDEHVGKFSIWYVYQCLGEVIVCVGCPKIKDAHQQSFIP